MDLFAVWPALLIVLLSGPLLNAQVLFVVMICCIYVAGLTETSRSGCGAGHVLAHYGRVQGLWVYHCLICLCCSMFVSGGGWICQSVVGGGVLHNVLSVFRSASLNGVSLFISL